MSSVFSLARIALSLGLPAGIIDRGPSLRGTKFLAKSALKARLSGAKRRFQMVNVGACDGVLFDDVTPWLHRIPYARAVLVEPIPHNQKRLHANYTDTGRFVIEPVEVTKTKGTITVHTFDAAALEAGTLPIEFIGWSSVTDINLMSGKNAWGQADANFNKFAPHLRDIEVPSETLQTLLDRNGITHIDPSLSIAKAPTGSSSSSST
nr:FkbM family methyltransferase [Mesorhizobium sp.]